MPTIDFDDFAVDPHKVRDGVWWEIHRNPDGTYGGKALPGGPGEGPALLIRPQGVEWERALDAARRPHLFNMRDKRVPTDIEVQILAEAMAAALWRGAANITLGGASFEWREDRAAKMLAEVRHENLRAFILGVSQDRAALAAQEEEKAAGN